ncbi:MAG: S4 domain-containing protein [Saprospiraceae bacterium]
MNESTAIMRLNKFVAHCGICTRKQAVDIIKKGWVSVNDTVVLDPFYEVQVSDQVKHKEKIICIEEEKFYFLMNKPKNIPIFTPKEDENQVSATSLLIKKTPVPLFPLLPMDDRTCGLMVFTNDQVLISKLSLPNRMIKSIFEVILSRPVEEEDVTRLQIISKDDAYGLNITGMHFADPEDKTKIGVELLHGYDSDLIRLFTDFGIEVIKCDRTFLTGLTKKDLKRGWSRPLTEKEVIFLKHFN